MVEKKIAYIGRGDVVYLGVKNWYQRNKFLKD